MNEHTDIYMNVCVLAHQRLTEIWPIKISQEKMDYFEKDGQINSYLRKQLLNSCIILYIKINLKWTKIYI